MELLAQFVTGPGIFARLPFSLLAGLAIVCLAGGTLLPCLMVGVLRSRLRSTQSDEPRQEGQRWIDLSITLLSVIPPLLWATFLTLRFGSKGQLPFLMLFVNVLCSLLSVLFAWIGRGKGRKALLMAQAVMLAVIVCTLFWAAAVAYRDRGKAFFGSNEIGMHLPWAQGR